MLLSWKELKYWKSIPQKWLGVWEDSTGRTLELKATKHDFVTVSIIDKEGKPFEIDLFDGRSKDTINMTAIRAKDEKGLPFLEIEAGLFQIGPTYKLYFMSNQEKSEQRKIASRRDSIKNTQIVPVLGMGLYDDFEDDLGVPWALPLVPFSKKS